MNLPFNVSEREKKFVIVGGIIAFLIIIFYVMSWYAQIREDVRNYSDSRFFMIEKQLNKMSDRDVLQKRVGILMKEIERKEKAFLRGDKPPVAAAALQKLLKETAAPLNIEVKLERALNPVDTEFYLGIPVEIGFTASTNKLKDLLYNLRKSPVFLTVSEIKIRVTRVNNPMSIYTTLVVTGFIKKPEDQGTVNKEAKNAA